MDSLSARRRSPLASLAVVVLGLVVTGSLYAVLAPGQSARAAAGAAEQAGSPSALQRGRELFLANCSSCHGTNLEGSSDGPSLVGVGAAAVDFQVGTGRMPAYTSQVAQLPKSQVLFAQDEINDLAAFVASYAPGPAIPTEEQYSPTGVSAEQIAEGGETFRTNCAMCHNASGAGGALTRGKFAPSLQGVSAKHIFEAMETGPQSMPVFGQSLPDEQKKNVIAYLTQIQEEPSYGGLTLGKVGPVTEGLLAWVAGIGALIGVAVWLGAKSS